MCYRIIMRTPCVELYCEFYYSLLSNQYWIYRIFLNKLNFNSFNYTILLYIIKFHTHFQHNN